MHKLLKKILQIVRNKFFLLGIVICTVGLFGFEYSLKYASTNSFCDRCHTMNQFTDSWKQSSHYKNEHGVVANCVDCHLPPKNGLFDVKHIYYKSYFGAKDTFVQFLTDTEEIDWEEKLDHTKSFVFDEGCMTCHQNLLSPAMSKPAIYSHTLYLKGEAEPKEIKCVDCHLNFVHFD